MGNTAAARYQTVKKLKSELSDLNQQLQAVQAVQRKEVLALEHRLHALSEERRNAGFFPQTIEKGGVYRYGATLETDEDVHVLVGPVIGKVTEDSAIVLLEIDATHEITCFVSLLDDAAPQGRVVAAVAQTMPANAPRAFKISGLSAAQRYKVSFSGVCRKDAEERIGQFMTYNILTKSLRAIVVAADRPQSLTRGDPNIWERLAAKAANYDLDVVLHIGGQVYSSEAFKQAWTLFQRHEQTGFATMSQHEIEEISKEKLRDVYRYCWNLPRTRKVLSSVSNIMMLNDEDIFKDFTIAMDAVGNPPSKSMIRVAQEVYREYQRQLWDPDCVVKGLGEGADDSNAKKESEALFKSIRDRKLQIKKMDDTDTESDDDEELIRGLEQKPSQEHHFHLYGHIGVLFIDMRGGRMLASGGQARDNPIISDIQWDHIQETLKNPECRALLVCIERPLVEESPAEAKKKARRPETVAVKERWAYNSKELTRILTMLSEWKTSKEGNGLLIVSGGLRIGGETKIKHVATGTLLRQIMVGPLTDTLLPFNQLLEGEADDNGMFRYEHFPMKRPQRNYLSLNIKVESMYEKPEMKVRLVGAIERATRALLGPVIGKVTSTTAVVLLEVEQSAIVTMVMTDILSRQTFRFSQRLQGRKPKSFVAKGLRPERRYLIHFEGISRWLQHRGAVTTLPTDPEELTFVCVHNDRVNEMEANDENPWHRIYEQLQYPWGGPDLIIHLGGQVDPRNTFQDAINVLRREGEAAVMEEKALDIIRNAYRFAWNLPHTKESLASCSNLMIWSDLDLAEGFTWPSGGPALGSENATWGPTILRLCRRAYREYQRQLWDPEMTAEWEPKEGSNGVSERFSIMWGNIGIVFLDMRGARLGASGNILHKSKSLLSEQHWREIVATLASPRLKALVVCCEFPYVDESPEDASIKGLHPSKACLRDQWSYNQTDLMRLLDTLFAWKNDGKKGARDVVLMAGGLRSGTNTIIRDGLTGLTIRQVIPPPISAKADDFEAELKGRLDTEDRMTYTHRPVTGRGFGILQMKVEELVKKKTIEEQALEELKELEEEKEGEDGEGDEKKEDITTDGSKNKGGDDDDDTEGMDDFMSEDDLKGKIDVDLWSVNLRKGSMNLGAKLTRIPTWLRRTVEMAMERDNVEEDEEEEEEVNVDIDEDTPHGGLMLGKTISAARRNLSALSGQDTFKNNAMRIYERFSAKGNGVPKDSMLEAARYLFYEKVGPEVRSIVPSPDDDLSTGTIIYLALSYVLIDHKAKVIPREKFTGFMKDTLETMLIIRKEVL